MTYDLSFSEDFFTDETFPYDTEKSKHPTNVYQAIISLPRSELSAIGRKVLGIPSRNISFWLDSESMGSDILDKIRETNTCSNLNSPVVVWIDPEGDYQVKVWDKSNIPEKKPRKTRTKKQARVLNLDDESVDTLREYSKDKTLNKWQRTYAGLKADAMVARAAGNITLAMRIERDLEKIYDYQLPTALRW